MPRRNQRSYKSGQNYIFRHHKTAEPFNLILFKELIVLNFVIFRVNDTYWIEFSVSSHPLMSCYVLWRSSFLPCSSVHRRQSLPNTSKQAENNKLNSEGTKNKQETNYNDSRGRGLMLSNQYLTECMNQ